MPKRYTPQDIRAELTRRDLSCGALARRLGCSSRLVCYVVDGRRKNLDVRRAIADAIGERIETLWPTRRRPAA